MNARYLAERQLPILHRFMAVHKNSMSKSHEFRVAVKEELAQAGGNLRKPAKDIKDKIAAQVALIGNYTIVFSSDDLSQVTSKSDPQKSVIVNGQARTCGCREWQRNGYPCRHACLHLLRHPRGAREPEHEAHEYFHLARYVAHVLPACFSRLMSRLRLPRNVCDSGSLEAMYKPIYRPILLENIVADPLIQAPLPKVTGPGRRETKRFRSQGEGGGPRKKQTHRCQNCGGVGHNARSCKNAHVPCDRWPQLASQETAVAL